MWLKSSLIHYILSATDTLTTKSPYWVLRTIKVASLDHMPYAIYYFKKSVLLLKKRLIWLVTNKDSAYFGVLAWRQPWLMQLHNQNSPWRNNNCNHPNTSLSPIWYYDNAILVINQNRKKNPVKNCFPLKKSMFTLNAFDTILRNSLSYLWNLKWCL